MDTKIEAKPQLASTDSITSPIATPSTPINETQTPAPVDPVDPVDPMDIKPENSVLNKTVSKGVDLKDSMASADEIQNYGSLNNEIVKRKMNYSLIAIIAGVLVLGITAVTYYFLVISKQSSSQTTGTMSETPVAVEETAPEETQPTSNQNVNTDIGADQVINDLNGVGNSGSTTQIQTELDAIDFEGIDTTLQLSDF